MITEFIIALAHDDEAQKWHCVVQNEGQYSRFDKTSVNACLEELRIRLNKRKKQNLMFPVSHLLDANGQRLRTQSAA